MAYEEKLVQEYAEQQAYENLSELPTVTKQNVILKITKQIGIENLVEVLNKLSFDEKEFLLENIN